MKRVLQLLFSVCIFASGFSQNLKPIAQKVANYQAANKNFVKYSPFTKDTASTNTSLYSKEASDVTVMQIKPSELQKIVTEKPDAMEMTFPFENGDVTVELIKHNIFTNDFQVKTDKGTFAYTPGVYYQGIVKGDNNSIAAFSFFNDEIVGSASIQNIGNIVVGKTENSQDYVSYNDQKMLIQNPFVCGVEELPENQDKPISYNPSTMTAKDVSNFCIRIYYEVGNNVYTNHSSSTTATTNFVTGRFNNVQTLYANENITVALSEMFIWTTADPYVYTGTGGTSSPQYPGFMLDLFRTTRTTFNGDAAQLLKNPSTTSIAYLDTLCTNNHYSFVGLDAGTTNVPTYSWNVMAMTHELGHTLGSPHTHGCYWNGNNTAIDGCAPTYDPSLAEGTCPIGPLPVGVGGTIMSYCHLLSYVGTNFANGFGPQPGDLIRSRIASSACLGSDCLTSCTATISAMALSNLTNTGVTLNITDTDTSATEWKYRISKVDGTVIQSGTSSSKIIDISGLTPNSFYIADVGSDCSPAYQKTQIFLTEDDWCSGTVTDTGGESGDYTANENWTHTFYPSDPTQKLTITFNEFNLADGSTLILRNGLTTSPTFAGTFSDANPPSGSYTSTHATGALTITFKSGTAIESGFKATLSCLLGVEDIGGQKGISLLPNPAKNQFKIEGQEKIENVTVFDASGRLVKQYDSDSVSKNVYDVSKLKIGTYVITIKTDKETISKKLIRE